MRLVSGVPDIAVEVVSPSNTASQDDRKIGEYQAARSQRVWVMFPANRTVVIHNANGANISYSDEDVFTVDELLPGFSLPLSEVFR